MGDQQKSRSNLNIRQASQLSKTGITAADRSFSKLKMKRPSYGFGRVPGITPTGPRNSQLGIEFKRPPLVYLPTYQLDSHRPVKNAEVKAMLDVFLDDNFTGHKYNIQDSPALALRLSGEIMRKLKTMEYNRYRYIVVVTIMQKRAQCYNNAITFLWDYERDTYIDVERETNSTFIQITVFAVYLD